MLVRFKCDCTLNDGKIKEGTIAKVLNVHEELNTVQIIVGTVDDPYFVPINIFTTFTEEINK